jgi:hypothetical protein
MKTLPALAALLLGIACTLTAHAEANLSGYWLTAYGQIPPVRKATAPEQALIDLMPKDTLLLADSGLVEFPPGNFGGLEVTPEYKARADKYDIEVQRSVSTTCRPPSIIYSTQGPFPIEIFQGRDLIVIKMEYFDVVRVIFMNDKTHPENWPLSVTGHSIGHWEGDTLVVDTVRIGAATLLNNGLDHSDNMHLLERFRLSPDGKTLMITQEYSDPAVFKGRAARFIPMNKGKPSDHVFPYDCDPAYGSAIEGRAK